MKGSVKGLNTVLGNLNREIAGIKDRSMAGLYEAGFKVEAASNNKVPVEYGNLRASSYTRKGEKNTVEVGYTASYAVFVHENLEMKMYGQPRYSGLGVYWGPKGRPKFLESTLSENRENILNIIRQRAKLSE